MVVNKIWHKLFKRRLAFKKHPLTKNEVNKALLRYIQFNVIQNIFPMRRIYSWIKGLKFYALKGDAGIVANIYFKLSDYEESMFLMRFLKEDDLFIDIGANVGHFSLLAAGISKANVISIEPIPSTFKKLKANIQLNHLCDKIISYNIGIGDKDSTLSFIIDKDVMNRVALGFEKNSIEVKVETLDSLLKNQNPNFIKIDVEGFEYAVLKGAKNVLTNPSLQFLILEFNGSSLKYGYADNEVYEILLENDFIPVSYSVENEKIEPLLGYNTVQFNTIFIRKNLLNCLND